jgi:hypothetical protein
MDDQGMLSNLCGGFSDIAICFESGDGIVVNKRRADTTVGVLNHLQENATIRCSDAKSSGPKGSFVLILVSGFQSTFLGYLLDENQTRSERLRRGAGSRRLREEG